MTLMETSSRPDVLTWGWIHPRVLLPRGADAWTDERLRIVLGHELAHIQRSDWAVQLIAEGLRVAQWFNPIVWIACRKLRDESEQACDDVVLSRGVHPETYATHLIDLARAARAKRERVPAPAVARPPDLERRIVAMLKSTVNRRGPSRLARFSMAAGTVVTAMLIAGFGLAAQSASVSGTVVDQAGHVIPGASVRIVHRATRAVQSVVTDEGGRYLADGLAPGSYNVIVTRPGFSRRFHRVELGSGDQRDETFELALGRVEETILVTYTGEEVEPRPVTASTPRPPRQAAPGQSILPPVKIRDLAPRYPESAHGRGFEAKVMIDAVITSEGFIEVRHLLVPVDPDTMTPLNADIARAAAAAVRQWQYEPTRLHDVPVETGMDVSVTFRSER